MAHSTLGNTQETVDDVFYALEARGLLNLGNAIDRYELVYQVSKEIACAVSTNHSDHTKTFIQSH